MTDPITPIMQAAEQWRRLCNGETPEAVFGDPDENRAAHDGLAIYLANEFVNILPKGKRPVACRCDPGSVRFTRGGQRVETRENGETIGWSRLPEVYEASIVASCSSARSRDGTAGRKTMEREFPAEIVHAAERVRSSNYMRLDREGSDIIGQWFDEEAFESDVRKIADYILKTPRY